MMQFLAGGKTGVKALNPMEFDPGMTPVRRGAEKRFESAERKRKERLRSEDLSYSRSARRAYDSRFPLSPLLAHISLTTPGVEGTRFFWDGAYVIVSIRLRWRSSYYVELHVRWAGRDKA